MTRQSRVQQTQDHVNKDGLVNDLDDIWKVLGLHPLVQYTEGHIVDRIHAAQILLETPSIREYCEMYNITADRVRDIRGLLSDGTEGTWMDRIEKQSDIFHINDPLMENLSLPWNPELGVPITVVATRLSKSPFAYTNQNTNVDPKSLKPVYKGTSPEADDVHEMSWLEHEYYVLLNWWHQSLKNKREEKLKKEDEKEDKLRLQETVEVFQELQASFMEEKEQLDLEKHALEEQNLELTEQILKLQAEHRRPRSSAPTRKLEVDNDRLQQVEAENERLRSNIDEMKQGLGKLMRGSRESSVL
ncbi:hypothetical protein LTR56_024285 [Elasticomyces elasticus]|nr:hypothetical protein LTR22_027871 [Elasticomyces elasticus]KAK3619030.1 hypothetical protein LTR56_024285 [Elasticomyces elasticus]KAK4905898.1 hypothetical protein LTR49_024868 [Elasticomyces elasticus]